MIPPPQGAHIDARLGADDGGAARGHARRVDDARRRQGAGGSLPAEEHPEVNRHDSLIETESADEEEQLLMSEVRDESPDMYDEYPAAVDASEGQEAVWHEDEYSTVESVYYVKPERENKLRGMLPRRMRVPFFRRGKKAQKTN